MIIAGYYCYLTRWKWTVSSSFRVAESEYRRWWHFGGVYRGELEFLRTIFSVGSVDLIVSFANARNWILQPIVIATICSLPMFRPEVACYFPCSRCPALIIQTWWENIAHAYVTSGIASLVLLFFFFSMKILLYKQGYTNSIELIKECTLTTTYTTINYA